MALKNDMHVAPENDTRPENDMRVAPKNDMYVAPENDMRPQE